MSLSEASNRADSQYLIISSHQDIGWMDSPERCARDRDENIITPALQLLEQNPAYHFDLEDVHCLREYLERRPDRRELIHRLLEEGRLQVGASYNQPYEELSSGEMLVRQFHAGRKWLRDNFPGCDTHTYWNPDVPGRTLQMAQILVRAGAPRLVMSRFARGLFHWSSPDGSTVTAFSPGHYSAFRSSTHGREFPEVAARIATAALEWKREVPSAASTIPILFMSDMSGPEVLDELIAAWNGIREIRDENGRSRPLTVPPIRYAGMEDFMDSVTRINRKVPEIRGERPDIWLYIHGPTHHRAISAKREADVTLPAAEAFSTVDALLEGSFARYPQRELTAAWEAQIYPDHGWGGRNGEITDEVFRAKYEEARSAAASLLQRALASISRRIKTRRSRGVSVVVFNSLSWARSGPVECQVDFAPGEVPKGLSVKDERGRGQLVQLRHAERHPDGTLKSARILFAARDVPSVGYATYYVRPERDSAPAAVIAAEAPALENDFYKVTLEPGGVGQVHDKMLAADLLDTRKFSGGELFTMRSSGEDRGEWAEIQQPTMEGFDRLKGHRVAWKITETGPVCSVAEARGALGDVDVVERVVLYHSFRRIDFELSLVNWKGTRYREFRLAFPVAAPNGNVAYEVAFGTVEVGKDEMKGAPGERYRQEPAEIHPRAIQNWISASGDRFGVTLSSSVAVWDYRDPTDAPAAIPLLQPVLLASRRSCHPQGPWYPQEGDHDFRFSLTSHPPDWRWGRRAAVEANTPLWPVVRPERGPRLALPERRSFVSFDAGNSVLSTLKKAADSDDVVIRLYEDAGIDDYTHLRFAFRISKAFSTDLLEEYDVPAESTGRGIGFFLGRHGIRTFKLRVKSD